jgi:uroporphyrinogen decarboxylase
MAAKILEDRMTSLERLAAFNSGKPYDRIPINPFMGDHAAYVANIKFSEYHSSAKSMAKAQITAYEEYHHDFVGVGPGLTGIAESLDSKVTFPDLSTPFVHDFFIKEKKDLAKLKFPDPVKSPRFAVILESLEILAGKIGREVPVSASIPGPLTTASNLRGAENLMKDIYKDPDFVHDLLEFIVEATKPFIKEVVKRGGRCGLGEPVASGSLISPSQFNEFVFPYLKNITAEIKNVSGISPQLHICGSTKKIWQLMVETGAGSLSLDDVVDISEAKKEIGDKITIVGNVSPTNSMYLGTKKTIEENVKECLRKGYDSPKGYILSLGCGLPVFTPKENVHDFIDAGKKYGQYPFDKNLFI